MKITKALNSMQSSHKKNMKNTELPTDIPDIIPIKMPNDDGVVIIDSEFHTLFVSEEDPILKEFIAIDDGEEFQAIREIVPKHKKYTLYIDSFAHDKNQLHKILYELRKGTENDMLELRINSNGGYVSEGIMVYNTMREVFNGRTITFNDSTGYSMGAMIFSLGDERVAYEDSSLMYHTFSTGYFGKGDEIKSYIEYEDKHFQNFFFNKIVKTGFLTEEEYKELTIGKDFWIDSYGMAKRGISTHIIVGGFKLDNEAFIEWYEQEDDIYTWVEKKLVEMTENELAEETLVPKEKKDTKKKKTTKKTTKKKKPKEDTKPKKKTTKKKKPKEDTKPKKKK